MARGNFTDNRGKGPNPGEGGRPKIEFDWSKLDAVLQYRASLEDCASLMECSTETVRNKIRDKFNMTFLEYRSKRMAGTKLTLVQKAIQMAKDDKNTTMMIFCLKNLCGWADKNETTLTGGDNTIKLNYNLN